MSEVSLCAVFRQGSGLRGGLAAHGAGVGAFPGTGLPRPYGNATW